MREIFSSFDMRGAQKAQPFGHPLDGKGLDRCVAEGTKNRIDTSLIARALSLEPFKYIVIDPKRD